MKRLLLVLRLQGFGVGNVPGKLSRVWIFFVIGVADARQSCQSKESAN
jgi:hypothetical protein